MIRTILQDQTPQLRRYLGRFLKQKRQGMELSLKDIAAKVGKTEAAYRSIESGHAKTAFETLNTLVMILDIDLQELYEISLIAKVSHANAIARELHEDYPS